tara:strand:+ start:206 stop:442 length:237 start_codon:yes stop_codon:yes gene_type:complete
MEYTKKELLNELNSITELANNLDEKLNDLQSIICDDVNDEILTDIENECYDSQFSIGIANEQYEFTSNIMKLINKIKE